MPMINWLSGFGQHRATEVSSTRLVNAYLEVVDSENPKVPVIAIGTPGTQIWKDCTSLGVTGAPRGWHQCTDGQVLVCIGDSVYRLDYDFGTGVKTITLLVSVGTGSTECIFADDGFQCLFTVNLSSYSYDMNLRTCNTLLIDTFLFPIAVAYAGRRFVMVCADDNMGDTTKPAKIARNNNKFFWSNSGIDGYQTWDATSFEAKRTNAQPVVAMAVRLGELWIYSSTGYEVWRPTGVDEAPFEFAGGSSSEIGCASEKSVRTIADQIFWVGASTIGSNSIFVSSDGYMAKKISTQAVEYQMGHAEKQLGTIINDWQGVVYAQESHLFYIISSTMADLTFAYDLTTGKWHTRSTTDAHGTSQHRWHVAYAMYVFGKLLVMDYLNPYIMEMSLDFYRDYIPVNDALGGRNITAIVQSPVQWNGLQAFKINEFCIDFGMGAGIPVIGYQGANPQAMLNISRDGGNTFGVDRWMPIGKTGEFGRRLRWQQLGEARSLVLRVTISDPVKRVFIGANLSIETSRAR